MKPTEDVWAVLKAIAIGLLLGLLLAAWDEASAAEFDAPYQGGHLRLMSMPCKWSQQLQAGYLKPGVGERVWACWVFENDEVWFKLEGGDGLMHMPWAEFSVVTDGSEYKAAMPDRPKFKEGL